jgi:hypothetical protein
MTSPKHYLTTGLAMYKKITHRKMPFYYNITFIKLLFLLSRYYSIFLFVFLFSFLLFYFVFHFSTYYSVFFYSDLLLLLSLPFLLKIIYSFGNLNYRVALLR